MSDLPWPKPVKPDGITDWEWDIYQNSEVRKINPELQAKVREALGWQPEPEPSGLNARLRAALRLLDNEHITPQGRRILEKILDEEEKK